jgi:hypothetical protein
MQDAPRSDREEDSRPGSPAPAQAPLDGPTRERLEFLTCDPFERAPGPEPDERARGAE